MEVSTNNSFEIFDCEKGISSEVFKKDNHVYKINNRNSLARTIHDYSELKEILSGIGFEDKLQESEIFSCECNGQAAICVKQQIIDGKTISRLGKNALVNYLQSRPQEVVFLKNLIGIFFTRVNTRQLYPDLVGNPADQSLWNSINLMVDDVRGIIICDVGLSPHEKTLTEKGQIFFESDNVRHYVQKMEESLDFLNSLKVSN